MEKNGFAKSFDGRIERLMQKNCKTGKNEKNGFEV